MLHDAQAHNHVDLAERLAQYGIAGHFEDALRSGEVRDVVQVLLFAGYSQARARALAVALLESSGRRPDVG